VPLPVEVNVGGGTGHLLDLAGAERAVTGVVGPVRGSGLLPGGPGERSDQTCVQRVPRMTAVFGAEATLG